MTILDKIIAQKEIEVKELKVVYSFGQSQHNKHKAIAL